MEKQFYEADFGRCSRNTLRLNRL